MKWSYTALFYFALGSEAYGDAPIAIPKISFSESYASNVDVSGSVLASSFVLGSEAHASPERLYVFMPKWVPELNIVVSSIDGKYSADAKVDLTTEQHGWLNFKIPTEYQKEFVKYLPNRLVAFAFVDSVDMFGNYIQEVYPTSWGLPSNYNIQLFMNSAGPEPNITFVNLQQNVITEDCILLNEEYTRVFNHVCSFGDHTTENKVIVTFSPDRDSEGKNYVIWKIDDK